MKFLDNFHERFSEDSEVTVKKIPIKSRKKTVDKEYKSEVLDPDFVPDCPKKRSKQSKKGEIKEKATQSEAIP